MAERRRPGRPRTGRSPRSTRHVKLEQPVDDALCKLSTRSGIAINALIKRAIKKFIAADDPAISGAQINRPTGESS